MRYADYYDCDICNGNSVGMSLFVSGCPIHCPGCFNADIWDFNSGKEWTQEVEEKFLDLVGRDYIKRVSFLGGSPLCEENVFDVSQLIGKIRERYPDKEIWVYTGYTWETINTEISIDNLDKSIVYASRMFVLNNINVLVDGQFLSNEKDISLAFRGSRNQRIIDVQESLKTGKVVLWKEKE